MARISRFAFGGVLGFVVGWKLGSYLVARRRNEAPEISRTVMAYCLKCRTKRPMRRPRRVFTKDGRPAIKGTCPECGGGMFRFVKA